MKHILTLSIIMLFAGAGFGADDDPVITGDDYWQHTDGPYGGSVWALYADDNILLAGTLSHGVYFSTDHGESWLQSGLDEGSIFDITRSEDGTLIAVGQEGVFLSFNNGRSWEKTSDGLGDAKPQAVLAVSEDEVHLATIGGGMFKWDAGNSSWVENNEGLGLKFGYSLAQHNDQVYAGITNDIYRWNAEAESWEKLNLDLPSIRVNAMKSYNNRLFVATQAGVYVSDESGDEWEKLNTDFADNYTYSFAEYQNRLYIGTRQGPFYTEDGENWQTYGLSEYTVYSLAMGNNTLFSGGNPGVFFAR